MKCEHKDFIAEVGVGRLSETEGGPITHYTADITVKCSECGVSFDFIGVRHGIDPNAPTMSLDRTKLHAPIEPHGTVMRGKIGFGLTMSLPASDA